MTTFARTRRHRSTTRHAITIDAAPALAGRIATVLGLLSLLSAAWPRGRQLMSSISGVLPAPPPGAAEAMVAVSGVVLLRIAAGLRRRKRDEWLVAVGVCASLTVVHLLAQWRRPIEATVTALLLALLLIARSQFTARADPHSRWYGARVSLQFLAVAVGYGTVLLYLPGRVAAHPSLLARWREVMLALVGISGPLHLRDERFADIFGATLLTFGVLVIATATALMLRTATPLATLDATDEQRLRTLLRSYGERDSLGYFALRRDKSVIWSQSNKSAITYRVVDGVALVSGDPIGDPEAWPGAISAYFDLIREHGWTPAVLGCSELGATVFRRERGLRALALGDEAIIDVATFSLDGRSMRGVRQACTRVFRAGYDVEVRRTGTLSAADVTELRAAAEQWRGDAVERGYSMALSRIGDPSDPNCVVAVARYDGALCGLLHFVPWGDAGLSLDLMRRDRSSANGLNELMIVQTITACADLGVRQVSLNFAVFRDTLERGARIGAGPILQLWRRLLLIASRWWQIDSLFRFNEKFHPQWEPRFVCFAALRDIPRVALASMEAEAFFVRPTLLSRLLGHRDGTL